ncbi:sugar phosphate isomerase/epimerase family protein [Verrucomicrobiota bacterium]
MPTVSYSTAGLGNLNVESALDVIADAGFRSAELLGQRPHVEIPPTGRALAAFRARLEERGLSDCSVHAPMGDTAPGLIDEAQRVAKCQGLAGVIRFCGAIGGTYVVMHPVPNPQFVDDPGHPDVPARMRDAVRRSLDTLIPVAVECGVRILFENLPYKAAFPFLCARELRDLVEDYPPDCLGILIDTGHAWTSKLDPAYEILESGPRLQGTHLQDVDHDNPADNHWVPTSGGLNWEEIRAALATVRYQGAWTFEPAGRRGDERPEDLVRLTHEVAAAWNLFPVC